MPTRDAGALVDPADERLTVQLMLERHRDRAVKLSDERLHLPREEPYLEGHNTWIVNEPGSLLVVPVADIAQHHIANLCFFAQNGYCIYDDVNRRPIPGLDEFSDLIDSSEPIPLSFVEQYSLTEASAELMTSTYNGALLLQAMGLGGWSFDGIEHMALLGASGDPEVPGLAQHDPGRSRARLARASPRRRVRGERVPTRSGRNPRVSAGARRTGRRNRRRLTGHLCAGHRRRRDDRRHELRGSLHLVSEPGLGRAGRHRVVRGGRPGAGRSP